MNLKLTILLLGLFSISLNAQTYRGKVSDETGEPVFSALVKLKSNPTGGVYTDFDGNYAIVSSVSDGDTLFISSMGYASIKKYLPPTNEKVLILNFTLPIEAQQYGDDEGVVIVGKANKSKDIFQMQKKMNSNVTFDYISGELMSKLGDSKLDDAVARIPGISKVGSFITVRGLADRYVKTSVNGSAIPTLDPFTNNIKLDIFPAGLVDNVIVSKTASPDIPGDWAGAFLSIETKDFPSRLSVTVNTSFGYNTQSTFQDVISSERSSTDWLGFDNGLRDFNHFPRDNKPNFVSEPTNAQLIEFGGFQGDVEQYNFRPDQLTGTFMNIILVELGYLPTGLLYDSDAANQALQSFKDDYAEDTYHDLNQDIFSVGERLPNNWATVKRKAPLNFSQSFTIGNQINDVLGGGTLGFLGGFRYASSNKYDPESAYFRAANPPEGIGVGEDGKPTNNSIRAFFDQKAAEEKNGWSALFNLAYKFKKNHSLTFRFMPNVQGINKVQETFGINENTFSEGAIGTHEITQYYEEREQLIYQFGSTHLIPSKNLKINIDASMTNGKSNIPDFKTFEYIEFEDGSYSLTTNGNINRYFRELDENVKTIKLDFEFPLSDRKDRSRKIKSGGFYNYSDRSTGQYQYELRGGFDFEDGDFTSAIDNLDFSPAYGDQSVSYYNIESLPRDFSIGEQVVSGGYVMTDYQLSPRVRLSGGVRLEHSDVLTDLVDLIGVPEDDVIRDQAGPGDIVANPGIIDQVDILPSLNVIYKLNLDNENPANLRLNYSQSLARPSLRELSNIYYYDFEFRENILGNDELEITNIDNYDIRLEKFYKNGNNGSVSFFYKDFENHIELRRATLTSWSNVKESTAYGVEFQLQYGITKNIDFVSNVAVIDSETKTIKGETRTMFGQAPYVINTLLTYTLDSIGVAISAGYNVQGERLALIDDLQPFIFELPRNLVDLKIVKKLKEHWSFSLGVRNLLNAPTRRTYQLPSGEWEEGLDYDRFTYGTNYNLGISYKL